MKENAPHPFWSFLGQDGEISIISISSPNTNFEGKRREHVTQRPQEEQRPAKTKDHQTGNHRLLFGGGGGLFFCGGRYVIVVTTRGEEVPVRNRRLSQERKMRLPTDSKRARHGEVLCAVVWLGAPRGVPEVEREKTGSGSEGGSREVPFRKSGEKARHEANRGNERYRAERGIRGEGDVRGALGAASSCKNGADFDRGK